MQLGIGLGVQAEFRRSTVSRAHMALGYAFELICSQIMLPAMARTTESDVAICKGGGSQKSGAKTISHGFPYQVRTRLLPLQFSFEFCE